VTNHKIVYVCDSLSASNTAEVEMSLNEGSP